MTIEMVSQFHVYFTVGSMPVKHSLLNVKALVGAFNQERALVGAFSMITNLRMADSSSCTCCNIMSVVSAGLVPIRSDSGPLTQNWTWPLAPPSLGRDTNQ